MQAGRSTPGWTAPLLATLALLVASTAAAAENAARATSSERATVGYPDPERYRGAVDAFLRAEAEVPPPSGAIVATGSSSMRGWHERIADDLAPLRVVRRGFGGSNMADVVHFVDELVLRHAPRAVLLYEGDNDVALGASPADILRHFDALTSAIHAAAPKTRIYILAVKPSIARWRLWPVMAATNEQLERRAAEDERLVFIDVATPMLDEQGAPRKNIFLADGLHMNRAGYEIWRDAVRPVLIAAEGPFESTPQQPARPERQRRDH